MLYRTRFIIVVLTAFLLFLAISVSCHIDVKNGKYQFISNEADRHEVLMFFLDGVPPLGGEEVEEVLFDVNTPQARKRPEVVWYIHEPARTKKDCVRCHGNRLQRTFSREVQMTAQVPELCYECHEDLMPTALEGRVHGPVSVGVCLFCHDPHRTQNQYLLKKPIPELCFGCHKEAAIELIPEHSEEIYSKCNYCHEGHVSPEKFLLKPSWEEKAVEVEEPESETEIKEPESEAGPLVQ